MPDTEITIAAPRGANLEAFLSRTSSSGVLADERLAVLDALSQRILADPLLRSDPASVALSFWLRRASMTRLRDSFLTRLSAAAGTVAVPCGRVFHIAPANVDTLFVYSWALSFFCGNRNVVRLSTRTGPVVEALIHCAAGLMESEPLLRDHNAFVQYGRSDAVNTRLSEWCSHRVVWGGNETVQALRRIPLNPHASERSFASKFSWSVIRAAAWLMLESPARTRIAGDFFNDTFWFDQLACSSPHVIFWIGSAEDARAAAAIFDQELAEVIQRKRGNGDDISTAVLRRNFAFSQAVQGGAAFDPAQTGFTTVWIDDWRNIVREPCGGGYLTHTHAASLDETAAFVSGEDQTVTHAGFDGPELRTFAALAGARGLDRVVPVGQALNFSPDWDGYSLLQDFVRLVSVTTA